MSTHNLCFEQKYEKCMHFLSENFHFLLLKFSIYLNRLGFVMAIKMRSVTILIRLCECAIRNLYWTHVSERVFADVAVHLVSSLKHAYIMLTPLNPTFI